MDVQIPVPKLSAKEIMKNVAENRWEMQFVTAQTDLGGKVMEPASMSMSVITVRMEDVTTSV